jgi:hypothetical protein
MGWRYAEAAAFGTPGLSDNARWVLTCMAFRARDSGDEAGTYFAGHDVMATALAGVGATDQQQDAAHRKIRRGVTELERAGLIKRIGHQAPGIRARYLILIQPVD